MLTLQWEPALLTVAVAQLCSLQGVREPSAQREAAKMANPPIADWLRELPVVQLYISPPISSKAT